MAGGAGIYFGWRINGRRFVFDAPSRIVGRLAVGCVPVGVAIFLATFEGFWLSWLTLAISFASLFVVPQLIPETRTATVD